VKEVAGRIRLVAELDRVDLAELVEHASKEGARRQHREGRAQGEAHGCEAGGRHRVATGEAAPHRAARVPGGVGDQEAEERQAAGILHGRRQPGREPGRPGVPGAAAVPVAERPEGRERDQEGERHVRRDPVRVPDVKEVDGQQRRRQDRHRPPVGEPPGDVEGGERGGAEERREDTGHEVELRGVPGERPGHPVGRRPEHEAVDPRHHVHVEAGPVEEPGVQVPLMEADRPLHDAGLVGMVEIGQAVRHAPGPERQADRENEQKPQTDGRVRPSRRR
jgi:hypothetical protein